MTDGELINLIADKPIVLRGYGAIGKYLYHLICRQGRNPEVLVCERNSKEKKRIDEEGKVNTISFEEAIQSSGYVFVVASYYSKEIIIDELKKAGIGDERIVYGVTKEAWQDYLTEMDKRKRKPLKKLRFEIDVSMHCNLDCNCCSQFGPIAKEEFANLEEVEKDLSRLSELFHGQAERIYLIGGEPLLNSELIRFMRRSREHFGNAKIDVFTNGILLFKMSDAFWEACRECKIGIIVTKYPIKADYDGMKRLVDDNKVRFEFFGTSQDFKYMTPLGLNLNGMQDIKESFALCPEANNCIKLRNGRLYTCTRPAVIYKFNGHFGTNLKTSEEDSIDIYKAKTGDEILTFLSHPIPFCRYCDNKSHKEAVEWTHSKKVITEWT